MESLKTLIDYWNKRADYLLDELHNLAIIYKDRSNDFTTEETQKHREMVDKYQKQYKYISETIKVLMEVWNEQERNNNQHSESTIGVSR